MNFVGSILHHQYFHQYVRDTKQSQDSQIWKEKDK